MFDLAIVAIVGFVLGCVCGLMLGVIAVSHFFLKRPLFTKTNFMSKQKLKKELLNDENDEK